jgi:tetratricopeptide (TPR) repeat protein
MESYNRYDESEELRELIDKFEDMLVRKDVYYFDVGEFEDIIDFYLDENNLDKSGFAIKMAIEQHPNSTTFLLKKAQLLANSNKPDNAISLLNKIEETSFSEDMFDYYLLKANIFSQLRQYEKAIEQYKILLKNDYFDPSEIYMYISFEYENLGNYNKAIANLKKAIELDPDNDSILYEIGYCFEVVNRTEDSIKFFLQYIDRNPYSEAAWFNLGIAYSNIELYEKSIEANEYVIAINDGFSSAYFNKANALANLNRFDEAITVYEETLELEDAESTTYFYIGECYEKMANKEKAMYYYKKAVELDDSFSEAWMGIGSIHEEDGNAKEALFYMRKAVDSDPLNPNFWYMLGDVQYNLELISDALESYSKVIEISPEIPEIWLDYSDAYFELEEKEKAIESIIKGIEEAGRNASLLYRLAAYLFKTGKDAQAFLHLEDALNMDHEKHKELAEYAPELMSDSRITGLIELYSNKD